MEFLQDVAAAALGCLIGCPLGIWIGERIFEWNDTDPREEEHCETCHDVHGPVE